MLKESIYPHAKNEGLEFFYFSPIDNILNKPVDPFFVGQTFHKKVDLSVKFVKKAYSTENVGLHIQNSDGSFGVIGQIKRIY